MCKITTIEYHKEICTKLENEQLSVIIIPSKGGKVASILYKSNNFELLFQNGKDLLIHNSLGDDFAAGDASGFDDAFPAIEKENVLVNGMNISYPDHGEIWTADME